MKSITQLGTLAGIVAVLGILAMLGGLYQVFGGSIAAGLLGIGSGFWCFVTGFAIDALFGCEAKLTRMVELMEAEKARKVAAGNPQTMGTEAKSKWIV